MEQEPEEPTPLKLNLEGGLGNNFKRANEAIIASPPKESRGEFNKISPLTNKQVTGGKSRL